MEAMQNPEIDKAVSSIWQLSDDDRIKEQIRRRIANEHMYQRTWDKWAEEVEAAKAEAENAKAEVESAIAEAESAKAEANEYRTQNDSLIKQHESDLQRIRELEHMLENMS